MNCTAEGNPDPEYTWTAITSPGPGAVTGSTFTVLQNMVGYNRWRCQAKNTVMGTPVALDMDVEFEACTSMGS